MTQASHSNWKFACGTNASPSVLTDLEEVLELSELGSDVDLYEVTNWDSPAGEMEYIGGLSDGKEFSVECNWIPGAATHQRAVRAAKGLTLPFRATYLGSSPNTLYTGDAVYMGWTISPSQKEQSKVSYQFKITGSLTEAP